LQGWLFFWSFLPINGTSCRERRNADWGKRKKEAKIRMVEKEKSEVVRMWGIIELVWPQAQYTH
jgi:hypothetical protein